MKYSDPSPSISGFWEAKKWVSDLTLWTSAGMDNITSENVMKHLSYGAHVCHHFLKIF